MNSISTPRFVFRRFAPALLIAGLLWNQPAVGQPYEEKVALEQALKDFETRDPKMYKKLVAGLEHGEESREKVLQILKKHLAYMNTLAEAEKSDPKRFQMLREQEQLEEATKRLTRQIHRVGTSSEEGQILRNDLHSVLRRWFDVRHEMRVYKTQEIIRELETKSRELANASTHREEHVQDWLARITAGGRPGMEKRILELSQPQWNEKLAPALFEVTRKRSPKLAKKLEALGKTSKQQLLEALNQIASSHPEYVEEAKRFAESSPASHASVRAAVLAAHELLLERVDFDQRTLRISPEDHPRVYSAIQRIITAELEVSRDTLAKTQRALLKKNALLEQREMQKETIVQMKLAELIGPQDLFDW